MPFQKGHKLAKGGARPNSGPRKKEVVQAELIAGELVQKALEEKAKALSEVWLGLALGSGKFGIDPPTTRHAIDKILPEFDAQTYQRPIAIAVNITTGLEPERETNSGSILTIGIDGDGHKNGREET